MERREYEEKHRNNRLKYKAACEKAKISKADQCLLKQGAKDPSGSKYSSLFTAGQSAIAAGARGASSGGLRPLGPSYLMKRFLKGEGIAQKGFSKASQFFGKQVAKSATAKTLPSKLGGRTQTGAKMMAKSFLTPSSPQFAQHRYMGDYKEVNMGFRGTKGLAEGWKGTSNAKLTKGPMVSKLPTSSMSRSMAKTVAKSQASKLYGRSFGDRSSKASGSKGHESKGQASGQKAINKLSFAIKDLTNEKNLPSRGQ
jgi:hypothetical protein